MSNVNRLQLAYRSDIINSEQVEAAIKGLPCYGFHALHPGPENDLCKKTRAENELPAVKSDRLPAIPNMSGRLPRICIECPAFAPALKQLVALLPKR